MKYFFLSILIAPFLGVNVFAQTRGEVRGVILGNNPNATLTTGIGQVVEPVGIPVVKPLVGTPLAAPPKPQTTPSLQPTTEKTVKSKEIKYKVMYDYYQDAKNKEGNKGKDERALKKEASREMVLSNDFVLGNGMRGNEMKKVQTIPGQKTTRRTIRIPYSKPPPVKKVPYQ